MLDIYGKMPYIGWQYILLLPQCLLPIEGQMHVEEHLKCHELLNKERT